MHRRVRLMKPLYQIKANVANNRSNFNAAAA
jgi:hypothetical protein